MPWVPILLYIVYLVILTWPLNRIASALEAWPKRRVEPTTIDRPA